MDTNNLKAAIKALKKTKEMIHYSVQLLCSVEKGRIKPEHFEKNLIIPELESPNYYSFELDWEEYPEIFKQTTEDAQIFIASYALILCKAVANDESLRIEEEHNSDLFAAQMILKLIRDAMAHIQIKEGDDFAAPYWNIRGGNKRIFEIKKLGIVLDAKSLSGQRFKLGHIKGFSNLFKIIDFIISELELKVEAVLDD